MSNPFEPSGNQNQPGKPEWPAFPGVPEPEPTPEPKPQAQQPFQQTPPPPPPPQGQPGIQAGFQSGQQPQFQPQFAQQPMPSMPQGPKKTNVLGIIALVLAVLGAIAASIKAVMALGWIALPIAFILGIIALFMKNQGKVAAIAAIVISVVGTMIAGVMAVYFVAKDFGSEISGGETVVSGGNAQSDPKGIAGNKDQKGTTRENPLPIGTTIENKDWAVTVNSVDQDAAAKIKAKNEFNENPKPGNVQILVNMTYQYKGNKPEGEYLFPRVEFVTSTGNSISWTDTFLVAPDQLDSKGAMYNGATVSGNLPFEVPAAEVSKGTLAVSPGILGDKRFFSLK